MNNIDTSEWTAREALDFIGRRTVAINYPLEDKPVKESYAILSKFLQENGLEETEWS